MHISRAVLDRLGGEFEVEPGLGMTRDDYLKQNNIETFFISIKEVRITTVKTMGDPTRPIGAGDTILHLEKVETVGINNYTNMSLSCNSKLHKRLLKEA